MTTSARDFLGEEDLPAVDPLTDTLLHAVNTEVERDHVDDGLDRSAFLQRLILACARTLGSDSRPVVATIARTLDGGQILLLALLTLRQARRNQENLARFNPTNLKRTVNGLKRRLTILNTALSITPATESHDEADELARLNQAETLCLDFEQALDREGLGRAVRNSENCPRRLRAFLHNRNLAEAEVRAHIQALAAETTPKETVHTERLVDRLGIPLLRTLNDDEVRLRLEMAEKWGPQVDCLMCRHHGKPVTAAEEASLIGTLCSKVVASVRKNWSQAHAVGPEDAVQEALTHMEAGYLYQCSLLMFLVNKAKGILKKARRKQEKNVTYIEEVEYDKQPGTGTASRPSEDNPLRKYVLVQERYLLAEAFFRPAVRLRVKEVWKRMLLERVGEVKRKTEDDPKLTDTHLAQRLWELRHEVADGTSTEALRAWVNGLVETYAHVLKSQGRWSGKTSTDGKRLNGLIGEHGRKTSEKLTLKALRGVAKAGVTEEGVFALGPLDESTIAGTRRRLDQRMRVLSFILSAVANGAEDGRGDVSVRRHLMSTVGHDRVDAATMHKLAVLARASLADALDPSLISALACHVLVDGNPTEEDISNLRKMAGELARNREKLDQDDWNTAMVMARMDFACSWVDRHAEILKRLRGFKRKWVKYLLSSCWYVTVLQQRTRQESKSILRPPLEEESAIDEIVDELESALQ